MTPLRDKTVVTVFDFTDVNERDEDSERIVDELLLCRLTLFPRSFCSLQNKICLSAARLLKLRPQ